MESPSRRKTASCTESVNFALRRNTESGAKSTARPNWRCRKTLVALIFAILACVFYFDKLVLGPYATIRIHDSFDYEFCCLAPLGKLFLKNSFFAMRIMTGVIITAQDHLKTGDRVLGYGLTVDILNTII
jgi:hypothetical protein